MFARLIFSQNITKRKITSFSLDKLRIVWQNQSIIAYISWEANVTFY